MYTRFRPPSVDRLIALLGATLSQGRSVLVLLPDFVDSEILWQELNQQLWSQNLMWHSIPLAAHDDALTPAEILSQTLEVKWQPSRTPRTVANLLRQADLPAVIHLAGLHNLPAPRRCAWLEFVRQWGVASHGAADQGLQPSALCLLVHARDVLGTVPAAQLYLEVFWWWGFPSALEMQLYCRSREDPGEHQTAALWREHVLPSLAGNDMAMIDALWDVILADEQAIVRQLQIEAANRGWTIKACTASAIQHNSVFNYSIIVHPLPPTEIASLWSQGVVYASQEYGLELHSAALALLEQRETLRHRLWRGQAQLILPRIDQVRLALCSILTRRYGRDWPLRWEQPKSEQDIRAIQETPFACQWGHLFYLLMYVSELRAERHLLDVVRRARDLRNCLAHYRPVTYTQFEGLWRNLQDLMELEA